MTQAEILETMRRKEPSSLFYTMELGGNMRQLSKMEAEGLITSQSRHGRGRQRDWYMTEEQHILAYAMRCREWLANKTVPKGTEP